MTFRMNINIYLLSAKFKPVFLLFLKPAEPSGREV